MINFIAAEVEGITFASYFGFLGDGLFWAFLGVVLAVVLSSKKIMIAPKKGNSIIPRKTETNKGDFGFFREKGRS